MVCFVHYIIVYVAALKSDESEQFMMTVEDKKKKLQLKLFVAGQNNSTSGKTFVVYPQTVHASPCHDPTHGGQPGKKVFAGRR